MQQVAATNWTYSGGSCTSSGGNTYNYVRGGDRDGGGSNIGGGWDTDGDGKADVETLGEVEKAERKNANYVHGHTPIGGENNDPGGSDRGGNTSGERDGAPGGNKGSGDRGR